LKEPIQVAAILRNVFEQDCKVPLEIPLVFSMTVKDQYGRDVPRTKAFQDALKSGPEKKFDYPIPAKQGFQGGHLISHFFSMETPGVYSVTFSKDVYRLGTGRIVRITSNTIKVKVSNLVYPRTTPDCFTLFAKPEKETVKVGQPIRVIGILQNRVDEPCSVPWSSGKEDYSITVKNEFGADVAKIERKESPYNAGGSSYRFETNERRIWPVPTVSEMSIACWKNSPANETSPVSLCDSRRDAPRI